MTETKQDNRGVSVHSETCSGCQYCQLACSFVKTGAFNPAAARVRLHRVEGKEIYRLSFTKDCDRCGYCARYCFYGVLKEVGYYPKS